MASKRFKGTIKLDVRDSTPDWEPYLAPRVDQSKWPSEAERPPNILFVLYDDTGLAAWSPYGGGISMPTLDAIARQGLIYTQWHTAALCSPTRGMLLTGRNHHLNGNAAITEGANGFPGQHARLPDECATVAQILRDNGWSTFWVGKNHNVPETDVAQGGSKSQWPLAKGFDRFYGFIGGETNQWYPDLIVDNHPVELPEHHDPGFEHEGYHLSKDLADNAIQIIKDQQASHPSKPWYLWFCPGANHAPHHAPKEYIDKYWVGDNVALSDGWDGRSPFDFRRGYEEYRKWAAARMVEAGVLRAPAIENPLNPMMNPEGATEAYVENEADRVIPWDRIGAANPWGSAALTADELAEQEKQQKVYAKLMAVYAAFSEYTDAQVGRIVDYLKATNQYNNTVIIYAADNGASGEGSPYGTVNENKFFNDYPESTEENLAALPKFGGPDTYEHFPTGWAAATSTPFKMFKRYSQYAGGTCDPLVISWPNGIQVDPTAKNNIRHQYHHATDIVPTILDICRVDMPDYYKGTFQYPLSGISMTYTFPTTAKDLPTEKKRQYYAMLGTRAMWEEGWKAVALHAPLSGGSRFDEDTWQLYYVETLSPAKPTEPGQMDLSWVQADPAEATNLVSQSYLDSIRNNANLTVAEADARIKFLQIKVQHLVNLWFEEAGRNLVLPLDDRSAAQQLGIWRPTDEPENKPSYTYYPFAAPVPEAVAPNLRGRSYKIEADIKVEDLATCGGVIFAHGSRFGGHTLFIGPVAEGGASMINYEYNFLGIERQRLSIPMPTSSDFKITVSFVKTEVQESPPECHGPVTLSVTAAAPPTPASDTRSIRTQLGKFTLSGDGLCIGYDSADSISNLYSGANRFHGGEIKQVIITPTYEDTAKVPARIAAGLYAAD